MFEHLKPKYLLITGIMGTVLSYFVMSNDIIVKELRDIQGNPILAADGSALWGRDFLRTFILDIPGYLVLTISVLLISHSLYRLHKAHAKQPKT